MVLAFLLLACGPGVVLDDWDGRTDDGGATDGGTSDGGDMDGGGAAEVAVSDLEAMIHREMASIVVLTWTQDAPATAVAEYAFDDGDWLRTPEQVLDAGSQRLLLLGIPFATEVTWRLLLDGEPVAEDASITTGDLPWGFPEVDHVDGDPASWDPSARWILTGLTASSGGGNSQPWSFILDRMGRMVWASATPSGRTTFQPQLSADRTAILVDWNSWWGSFDGGAKSQVVVLDIEGDQLDLIDTPGMIHPFTQTGDGSLVWGRSLGASYLGEELVIRAPGEPPRTLWDCNAFMRSLGESVCGSNTVWWDPTNGHILFSLYSQNTVVEVDGDGKPVRWFGHIAGAWDFSPPESAFWWQHGVHFLPDGHLLVSTRRSKTASETVVREYALDEGSETLTEVWSFGEGEGAFAYILGEARRLDSGNTLHNYGWTPRIREATPDGDVVWDLSWDDTRTLGRMEVVDDLYALWHPDR